MGMKWVGDVDKMKCPQDHKILVGKRGEETAWQTWFKRGDNINMDFKATVCADVDWIQLAQRRVQ